MFPTQHLDELTRIIGEALDNGYYPPDKPIASAVTHQHRELVNFAVDGICVFAKLLNYMMSIRVPGVEITELQTPEEDIYRESTHYIRNTMDFRGLSGRVQFTENDLVRPTALWQVEGANVNLVSLAEDGSFDVSSVAFCTAP